MAKYYNSRIHDALYSLMHQIKQYYVACHNSRNYLTATEEAFNKLLLPKVEELIVDDIMNGGKHEYNRMEYKGQSILIVNNTAFCNYQAAKGMDLVTKYKCDLSQRPDLIEQGKSMLQVIYDFCNMSPDEFIGKYYVAGPETRGVDKFLYYLEKLYKPENFVVSMGSYTQIWGELYVDDRIKVALDYFCRCNPDSYRSEYKDSILYFDREPVTKIKVDLYFHRESEAEDFALEAVNVKLFLKGDISEYVPIHMKCSGTEGKALGVLFTKTAYPCCEELFREMEASKISSGRQGSSEEPRKQLDYDKLFTEEDTRNIREMLEDYEVVEEAFHALKEKYDATDDDLYDKSMDELLPEKENKIVLTFDQYRLFFVSVLEALDFAKSSTMVRTGEISAEGIKIKCVSLLKSVEEYAHALVTLSCGFDGYWTALLEEHREEPAQWEIMSPYEYKESVKAPQAIPLIERAIQEEMGNHDFMEELLANDVFMFAQKVEEQIFEYMDCIRPGLLIDDTLYLVMEGAENNDINVFYED